MYPRTYFDSYWRPQLADSVFVAMPFSEEFEGVWNEAYKPAITVDAQPRLGARRVDATTLSGSILTEILDGIAHCKLVLADISVQSSGPWAGQRNGNVLYELGIAHAVREPEAVLLLKRDALPITFDIAHMTVHQYDPADLAGTRSLVARMVKEMLSLRLQSASLLVQKAAAALNHEHVEYLQQFSSRVEVPTRGIYDKHKSHDAEFITFLTLNRLLELGIVGTVHRPGLATNTFASLTPFGRAVAAHLGVTIK